MSTFLYCTLQDRILSLATYLSPVCYCQFSSVVLYYCLLLLILPTLSSTVLSILSHSFTFLLCCVITASENFLLLLHFPLGGNMYKMDTDSQLTLHSVPTVIVLTSTSVTSTFLTSYANLLLLGDRFLPVILYLSLLSSSSAHNRSPHSSSLILLSLPCSSISYLHLSQVHFFLLHIT